VEGYELRVQIVWEQPCFVCMQTHVTVRSEVKIRRKVEAESSTCGSMEAQNKQHDVYMERIWGGCVTLSMHMNDDVLYNRASR
jgi:hypothetical protein